MSASRLIPPDLAKEIRALLPLWLGCVVLVWAGGLGDSFWFRVGFIAYLVGSAALGALSVGHEYTNGTLPMLLSLPISRRRMFAMKAAVLTLMLVLLASMAMARLPVTPLGRDLKDTALVGTLSFLSSLFLAPSLTMACRNVIAGAVFSLCLPASLMVGSELLAFVVTGQVDSPAFQSFKMRVLWNSMAVLSAFGAVASWRTFMKLETTDTQRSEFRHSRFIGRATSPAAARERSRPGHPVWNLVRKELHLQQLTFAVSGLFICGWIAALLIRRLTGPRDIEDGLLILTVVHGVVVALLSGSLASAEERHLGVLESQVLLPVSMMRQWMLKAGVVIGLCVLLAMVLPAALIWISEGASFVRINMPFAIIVMLAGVGLYVSSVSNSGVKALLIAGPAALSLVVLTPLLRDFVLWFARLVNIRPKGDVFGPGPTALIAMMVFTLLIGFGLTNHRSSDRSAIVIWRQILWLSGSVACVMLVALLAR